MRYLALPFVDDISKLTAFDSELYNFFPLNECRMYTRSTSLLPFVVPISSCDFIVTVRTLDGQSVASIPSSQLAHTVIKNGTQQYAMYDGSNIQCLDLDECSDYYLQIGGYYSEFFSVSDSPTLSKITFANRNSIGSVPYELGFTQFFWSDVSIAAPDQEQFQQTLKDEKGNVFVKYSRLTDIYTVTFPLIPTFLKEILQSSELIDTFKIEQGNISVTAAEKQTKVKAKRREGFRNIFDVDLEIVSTSYTEDGYCGSSIFAIDSTCPAVTTPATVVCPPSSGIKEVVVNCTNIINSVDVDCNVLPPPIFYAETYCN